MELGQIGMENRPEVFLGGDNMVKSGVFYWFVFFLSLFLDLLEMILFIFFPKQVLKKWVEDSELFLSVEIFSKR